jgi:hypothetical protein
MITKSISIEKQIAAGAERLCRIMPGDQGGTSWLATFLVNVASRAEELKTGGMSIEEIPEIAAQFGKELFRDFPHILTEFSDLPQKAANAASLFINNRQLALDSCNAFIRTRAEDYFDVRDGTYEGTMYEAAYKDALQEIIRAVNPTEAVSDALKPQESGQEDLKGAGTLEHQLRKGTEQSIWDLLERTDARLAAMEKRMDAIEGAIKEIKDAIRGIKVRQNGTENYQEKMKSELNKLEHAHTVYGSKH